MKVVGGSTAQLLLSTATRLPQNSGFRQCSLFPYDITLAVLARHFLVYFPGCFMVGY